MPKLWTDDEGKEWSETEIVVNPLVAWACVVVLSCLAAIMVFYAVLK